MDQHTQEGQAERAKRLREQIESLKSGHAQSQIEVGESLREQIAQRAREVPKAEGPPES